MKKLVLKLVTVLFLVINFISLSYRYRYWVRRFLGFAFIIRNRSSFFNIGEECFIASDVTLHNPQDISIGNHSEINRYTSLTTWRGDSRKTGPLIEIGNNVSIGEGAHITASNFIHLANDVLLGKYVTITDNSHGYSNSTDNLTPPMKRDVVSKGEVIIEERVWIGDKVTILPGVRVGAGSIIGSNSVVTKNIPKNSIAVGVPAAVVKNMKHKE